VNRFDAGSVVALREVWRDRVWKARPAVVVRDDELIALWTPDGAPMLVADAGSGIPTRAWSLVPFRAEWDALRLHAPGAPLVHVALWRDGSFEGWKVDVVRPFRRFVAGFGYLDLELDVRVVPDGGARLVDEDELAESCRRGVIDALEEAAVRRAAGVALAAAHDGASPFSDGWDRWRPDPGWPVPSLPAGWDTETADLPPLR
jgi:uncharacterized protein